MTNFVLNSNLYQMKGFFLYRVTVLFTILILVGSCFSDQTESVTSDSVEKDEEVKIVNVYSDRHYPVDDSIYARFEREFGIQVNLVKGKSEDLLSRIEKEGGATKADLLITADVGRLHQAKDAGFFQPVSLGDALANVPSYLYDEEGYWFGLTKRARVIVYSKERVKEGEIKNYEDLVDDQWKGRIAVRSKGNIYNQSLLASIIAANGEEVALEWVKGVVDNMYQSPKGNDRDQVKAVYAGKADLAIVNTYYIGKLMNSEDELERAAAQSVQVLYPNQENRGAHINVSGLGVLKASKNVEAAKKLIAFLLTPEIQEIYAKENYEFPVVKNVSASEDVLSWGSFKEDEVDLGKLGALNSTAIKVFDKGGWK